MRHETNVETLPGAPKLEMLSLTGTSILSMNIYLWFVGVYVLTGFVLVMGKSIIWVVNTGAALYHDYI